MTTTQLAPIADAIALELQDLRENHEYEKNQCQSAIASGDFIRASRSMHESMIWQYNQGFANQFNLDKIESTAKFANEIQTVMGSLMANILCTVSNPRAADLALQDAQKEQYKFLVKVQKMIARRN
jgi:hypothetical protein